VEIFQIVGIAVTQISLFFLVGWLVMRIPLLVVTLRKEWMVCSNFTSGGKASDLGFLGQFSQVSSF